MKIYTFTDESGQDTEGKLFVVCSVIINGNSALENSQFILEQIEDKSKKILKWSKSQYIHKIKYIELLLKSNIFSYVTLYYSVFTNRKNYTELIEIHISNALIDYCNITREYKVYIKIDKMDDKKINRIIKTIKDFGITYSKIRGIDEKKDCIIRLADSLCGVIRDIKDLKEKSLYKKLFLKINKI